MTYSYDTKGVYSREGGRKMTHTPGPWVIEETGLVTNIIDSKGQVVCEMFKVGSSRDVVAINLIAAAPDLLKAVKLWDAFWDNMPKGQLGKIVCDIGLLNDAFIATSSAIAKAEGKG